MINVSQTNACVFTSKAVARVRCGRGCECVPREVERVVREGERVAFVEVYVAISGLCVTVHRSCSDVILIVMFLDRLEIFLQEKCRVKAKDVPAILATFVTAKYFVWMGFVVTGAKFKPISKLVVQRILPSMAASVQSSSSQVAKGAIKARKEFVDGLKEQKYGKCAINPATDSFLVRLGRRYQYYSERLGEQVARNGTWKKVSGWIRQDPRHLAVGIAEGMIFYKVMIPVHIPLTLYVIIHYYQMTEEEEDGVAQTAVGYHGGVDSERDTKAIIESPAYDDRDEKDGVGVLLPTLRSLRTMTKQETEESIFEDIDAVVGNSVHESD